jgi:hypothetical protein
MSATPLYAAQVIIPKQQDITITAAVAMITINKFLHYRINATQLQEHSPKFS